MHACIIGTEAHTIVHWKLAGSFDRRHNQGYISAEGDIRLAELAAATNIKNTKKHSFKDVLRFGLRL